MSMLTSQVENLRIMARLVREYEYREISWALRHAADTIENLRNRLTERETCRISAIWVEDELEHDCREYVMHCESCNHQFGYILYNEDGNAWMHEKPKFCPICGARVVE